MSKGNIVLTVMVELVVGAVVLGALHVLGTAIGDDEVYRVDWDARNIAEWVSTAASLPVAVEIKYPFSVDVEVREGLVQVNHGSLFSTGRFNNFGLPVAKAKVDGEIWISSSEKIRIANQKSAMMDRCMPQKIEGGVVLTKEEIKLRSNKVVVAQGDAFAASDDLQILLQDGEDLTFTSSLHPVAMFAACKLRNAVGGYLLFEPGRNTVTITYPAEQKDEVMGALQAFVEVVG